jgi:hypothetical protein
MRTDLVSAETERVKQAERSVNALKAKVATLTEFDASEKREKALRAEARSILGDELANRLIGANDQISDQDHQLSDQIDNLFVGRATDTADVTALRAKYETDYDSALGVERHGAVINAVEISGHKAFSLGGVEMDVCGALTPAGIFLGANQIDGEKMAPVAYRMSAEACLGVKLGEVATVRDTAGFALHLTGREGNSSAAVSNRLTNTLSVERIGGTPLRTGWTYESAWADAGEGSPTKQVGTHLFTAGAAW